MDIRILHSYENTKVVRSDKPADGNACHNYQVSGVPTDNVKDGIFARVYFQKGPVKEVGVNGCQNEDLLRIVEDRLAGFQSGEFACIENKIALEAVQQALEALESRTRDRTKRGVEGKSLQ